MSASFYRGCVNAEDIYPKEFLNKQFSPEFVNLTFSNSSEFAGRGHYSIVRKETLTNGKNVAVKSLPSLNLKYLAKEVLILEALKDIPNTVKYIGFIGNESQPSIVYSYHSSSPTGYYGNISLKDFKWWLNTTLHAIADIHERGVIHRDLRLSNILADFEKRELAIIDFGLSDFYIKNQTSSTKVGCFHIKAPELVINLTNYGCAIDIWALGISCLDIMIKLRGNWSPKSNDQLNDDLVKYFGTIEWNNFVNKYNSKYHTKKKAFGSIFELAMPGNNHLLTPESLDLVKKMISLDPEERPTAREALTHKFFQDL